jgi:hypothetical protein
MNEATCVIYIDGDNQSPALAGAVLHAVQARDVAVRRVEVFGNTSGCRLDQWKAALTALPCLRAKVTVHEVPRHDQAADVALMLGLGAQLRALMADSCEVLIVSRDNVLLACAQRLQDMGLTVLVGHAGAASPLFSVPAVDLVQLAGPERPMVAMLRKNARPALGGGYLKSRVRQLMRRAGLDGPARAAFLASLPGLRETPIPGDHALYF